MRVCVWGLLGRMCCTFELSDSSVEQDSHLNQRPKKGQASSQQHTSAKNQPQNTRKSNKQNPHSKNGGGGAGDTARTRQQTRNKQN